MPYTYAIHETISGAFLEAADPATNRMGRRLRSGPAGSSSFAPVDGLTRADWDDLLTPWSRMLVKFQGDLVVAAHVFTGESFGSSSTLTTMNHVDIRAIFDRRTTFGSNGYSGDQPTENQLDVLNQQLGNIPSWLMWASTNGPGGGFDLPIYRAEGKITDALVHSLPGGAHTRIWRDDEIPFVGSALSEVESVSGGPDTEFDPVKVGGSIRFMLRSGALTGRDLSINLSAPESEATEWGYVKDAQKQSNVLYAIGNGSERSMLVRTAAAAPTVPALERAVPYRHITDTAVLQAHANADLALYNQPTRQWSVKVRADEFDGIASIPLGTTFQLYTKDHWRLADGWKPTRLIGYDTDETDSVTLVMQPTGGG